MDFDATDYVALIAALAGTGDLTQSETRDDGGILVAGTMGEHRFEAVVPKDHAEMPDHELDRSRINRLVLQRLSDRAVVAFFDRGWEIQPTTMFASQIVELLAHGLATYVFEDPPSDAP